MLLYVSSHHTEITSIKNYLQLAISYKNFIASKSINEILFNGNIWMVNEQGYIPRDRPVLLNLKELSPSMVISVKVLRYLKFIKQKKQQH